MACKYEQAINNEPSECLLNGGGDTCGGCEIGEVYEEVDRLKSKNERLTQAVADANKVIENTRKEIDEILEKAVEDLKKLLPKKEGIHHEHEGPRTQD